VGVSALYAFLVVYGFFQFFMLYWLIVVIVGGFIVKEIWNRGWRTVDPTPPSPSAPAGEVRIVAEGLRVPLPPERLEPDPPGPRTTGEKAGLVPAVAGGVVVVAVFSWGTQEMKVATIMVGTMLGLYAYFRSFTV
jgi:hypothetical protein